MSKFWRRFLLGLGILALGGACNPLMFPFYLTSPEPKFEASYKQLASKDKKKEVRVAILTYMGLETSGEFLHVDRDLSRKLAKNLGDLCKYNEEKVTIINPSKVEEYKNSHPDWHHEHLELEEIGKDLQVDYIIYLEIESMSMYQPNTGMTLYRGEASLNVQLVDVNKPDESPDSQTFTCTYPSEGRGGNVLVDADMRPQQFRDKFLNSMTRQLSWYFSPHPKSDSHSSDD